MGELGLIDQLRHQRGRQKGPFTCVRAGSGSATRIDRIYAKNRDGLQWDVDVTDEFGISSARSQPDHRAVRAVCTQVQLEERGRDLYRIDSALLEKAEVRHEIRDLYDAVHREHPHWGQVPPAFLPAVPWEELLGLVQ